MDKFIIFDMETDGLYNDVSTIHCLSYQVLVGGVTIESGSIVKTGTWAEFMLDLGEFFSDEDAYYVCHNMIRYDIPVAKKFTRVPSNIKRVDTLGLSWYLYNYRKKHGLEQWGYDVGVEKPFIEDWKEGTLQAYVHRCESDVEINKRVFVKMMGYMMSIYQDYNAVINAINYCNFKMDCLWEQEEAKIPLNVNKCEIYLEQLETMFNEKTEILVRSMPSDLGKIVRKKPKVCYKQDGTYSVHGAKWFQFLSDEGLPVDTEIVRELPNPGSSDQLKAWLDRLDWKPITFKVSKSTKQRIPQVSLPFGAGLCPSVKELYEKDEALKELDNYYRIKHRIGIFKSYLKNVDEDGFVFSGAHGFTNTMRLTHSEPVVNLPKPGTFYGKEIREVLCIPDDSYLMCGSDISSLEDNTKQHYIYYFDPQYVTEMRVPGFDPHVDIAVLAGLMTAEDAEWLQWANQQEDLSPSDILRLADLKKRRGIAKTGNFAATYGAGGPKIAETAKISIDEGYRLHKIYWDRNSAIKKTANACTVREVDAEYWATELVLTGHDDNNEPVYEKKRVTKQGKQKWLYNPVSGFWMMLKAEKDRFSTLNQSTGVFVFDSWLKKVREKLSVLEIPVIMQYHDELLLICPKQWKDEVEKRLKMAMHEVNQSLRLNVEIGISVDWGTNYAECH